MKKLIKILLVSLFIVILISIVVIYFSVRFIDTSPYFETKYYANTIENLNNNLKDRQSFRGNLFAGFAQKNITPKIVDGKSNAKNGEFNKIKLAGFGDGKIAAGVHDSLYVKAVALKVKENTVIFVSSDLLMMPPKVVEEIEEKLASQPNINRKQIYFGATHTHSSFGNCVPGFVGEKFEGEYQPKVVNWLANQIFSVILESVKDLKPSSIGNGFVHVPNLVSNRIIGKKGRLNDKLSILSIKQTLGRQTLIGSFAAHATVIGAWNNLFSGDYPGQFQSSLESRGIDMAMFYAGTVGSHTNRGKGEKYRKTEYIGKSLADSALTLLSKIKHSNLVELSSICSEIKTPELQIYYISDDLRLSSFIGEKLLPNIGKIYLQGLKINNFIWITMPCELSGEYAIDLKNALEIKGFNSSITSFNGQYLGYIVPAKYYYFDSYESRLMGWFGPSMGDYLMELNYTIADSLTGVKL